MAFIILMFRCSEQQGGRPGAVLTANTHHHQETLIPLADSSAHARVWADDLSQRGEGPVMQQVKELGGRRERINGGGAPRKTISFCLHSVAFLTVKGKYVQ